MITYLGKIVHKTPERQFPDAFKLIEKTDFHFVVAPNPVEAMGKLGEFAKEHYVNVESVTIQDVIR